jgi:Rrf2 family iron-sulfur cluster assembly transcriptional regulator
MRLTTKGRFAVTAMIDLALRSHTTGRSRWRRSASGSRSRCPTWSSCSASCAATSWWRARAAPAAAIRWAARPAEITVADIIVAVDEPIDATGCGGKENCMGEDAGKLHDARPVGQPEHKMIEYLDSISLKKLVDDQLAKGVSIERRRSSAPSPRVPVVKPIKVTAPNSVFAPGLAK